MRVNHFIPTHIILFWLILAGAFLAGCVPTSILSSATAIPPQQQPAAEPPAVATAVPGCSTGGAGVFTPDDVSCTLANAAPAEVQQLNEKMVVLFGDPQAGENWAGAAVIYHIPTHSILVLDRFGDGDPQAGIINSRAGLAAFSELTSDLSLMAGLKRQIQSKWQTTSSNEPEIRLSAAWQDGPTTVFFIAVAGLEPDDSRFYCPGESWTIGDETIEIAADCMAHEAGSPVGRFFFISQPITGGDERAVQVALDGLPSNIVQVSERLAAQETLIYQAVLQQITNRALIIRGETAPGSDGGSAASLAGVDPSLLKNYLAANEMPYSLHFLFQDSNVYFVQPQGTITRDYLIGADPKQACAQLRSDYPALGGVIALSRIGVSRDGSQALVHALQECGADDRLAAYYTLARIGEEWLVTESFATASGSPPLTPQMDYGSTANGCGDIVVYKSNNDRSEFLNLSINAMELALSEKPLTFDLAAHPETIAAWIDVYVDSVEKLGENPYCNDVGPTAVPRSVWRAVSGTVTASVSANAQTALCEGEPYQATLLIEDVTFALDEETVSLPALQFNDVTVGWCSG